jgi:hypothetical protein
MTDPNEKYEVGNINAPENLPRKSGDSQSGSILGDVRIKSQKNKGDQDRNGDIKTFSRLPDMLKQYSVFSNDLCLCVHNILLRAVGILEYWVSNRKFQI